jgi:iron complex transport system permease protein
VFVERIARTAAWCGGLSATLLVAVLASTAVGPVGLDPVVVVEAVLDGLVVPTSVALAPGHASLPVVGATVSWPAVEVGTTHVFAVSVPETAATIVRTIRLPRIALAAVVGFALGTAGVVMQGFFRNPMADPSIIGVSTGAAVGAVAAIVFPLAVPFGLGLQGAAFAGALCAGFGVYVIATEGGRTPVATLLLAGVAVQTFLGAVIATLLLHSGESLERVTYWLMGHLRGAGWDDVAVTLPLALAAFLVLAAYARDLNVLLLGEGDAHALGIEVERTKRVLLAVSSVVTAAAVAVSGVIGFVGLIVPHVMRLLVGPDHRILLPTSALAGAVFLVAADTLARSGPAELPVGIVTAAVGAPFFLYLLRRREVRAL